MKCRVIIYTDSCVVSLIFCILRSFSVWHCVSDLPCPDQTHALRNYSRQMCLIHLCWHARIELLIWFRSVQRNTHSSHQGNNGGEVGKESTIDWRNTACYVMERLYLSSGCGLLSLQYQGVVYWLLGLTLRKHYQRYERIWLKCFCAFTSLPIF